MIAVRLEHGGFALWESGGATRGRAGQITRGRAFIIADRDGLPPRAMRTRHTSRHGHALVRVREGMHVVIASVTDGDVRFISVYRIADLRDGDLALELVASRRDGVWEIEPPSFMTGAIEAACHKACHKSCDRAYWIHDPAAVREAA